MTETNPVTAAFEDLIAALKAEAVAGDFDRTTGFLRRAQDMHRRWSNGETAHTPKKKDA